MHSVARFLTRLTAAVALLAVAAVTVVTVAPKFLPIQARYVRSASMAPTLPVGAFAIYSQADAGELHRGDVIVFHRPDVPATDDSLVTHRIVRVEHTDAGAFFVTKGDANPRPDPWRVPATGSGWKLRASVPLAGYAVGLLGSPLGRTWIAALAAVLLGASLLVEIWRRPHAPAPRTSADVSEPAVATT